MHGNIGYKKRKGDTDMTNRIDTIRNTVETLLAEKGFRNVVIYANADRTSWIIGNNKTIDISIVDVIRGNGADADVSVRFIVSDMNNRYPLYYGKPITTTWGTKRIANEVARAIEAYRN